MPEKTGPIKSQISLDEYAVCFVNRSHKEVDVVWVNYSGGHQRYVTMRPKQYFRCKTFVSHPWLFRDAHSRRRLCCDTNANTRHNARIEDIRNNVLFVANDMPADGRLIVNIYDPILNLKEQCFENLFQHLAPNQDLEALDIPKTIINEYKSYIKLFYS